MALSSYGLELLGGVERPEHLHRGSLLGHEGHGANLLAACGAHLEDGLRPVADGLPESDHHAVLGEKPGLHGPKLLVLPGVEVLVQPELGEQLPVVGLLVAGVPVRPCLPEPGEHLPGQGPGRRHDVDADLVVNRGDQVEEEPVVVGVHPGVLAHCQVRQVDPGVLQASGQLDDLLPVLAVPLYLAVGPPEVAERAVVLAVGGEVDEAVGEDLPAEPGVPDLPGSLV